VVLQETLASKKKKAATDIQKVFRGYLARLKYQQALRDKERRERMDFFNKSAATIQKIWKGYYSRKNIHDYYKRQAYIRRVKEMGEKQREISREKYERWMEEEQQLKQAQTETKFKEETGRLHFMVSTKAIPGVFSHARIMTVVDRIPLEDHLRANRKVKKLDISRSKINSTANTSPPSPTTSKLFPPISPNSRSKKTENITPRLSPVITTTTTTTATTLLPTITGMSSKSDMSKPIPPRNPKVVVWQ